MVHGPILKATWSYKLPLLETTHVTHFYTFVTAFLLPQQTEQSLKCLLSGPLGVCVLLF